MTDKTEETTTSSQLDDGMDCPIDTFYLEVQKWSNETCARVRVHAGHETTRQVIGELRFKIDQTEKVEIFIQSTMFWPYSVGLRVIQLEFSPRNLDMRETYIIPRITYKLGTTTRHIELKMTKFILKDDAMDRTMVWQIPMEVSEEPQTAPSLISTEDDEIDAYEDEGSDTERGSSSEEEDDPMSIEDAAKDFFKIPADEYSTGAPVATLEEFKEGIAKGEVPGVSSPGQVQMRLLLQEINEPELFNRTLQLTGWRDDEHFPLSMTILEIKEKVSRLTKRPLEWLSVSNGERYRKDEETLADCEIEDECVEIEVWSCDPKKEEEAKEEPKSSGFTIFVKLIQPEGSSSLSERYAIERLHGTDRLWHLKSIVAERSHLTQGGFKLIFAGRQMEGEDKTLDEFGLHKEVTVHVLVLRKDEAKEAAQERFDAMYSKENEAVETLPFVDLGKFKVVAQRADGESWDNPLPTKADVQVGTLGEGDIKLNDDGTVSVKKGSPIHKLCFGCTYPGRDDNKCGSLVMKKLGANAIKIYKHWIWDTTKSVGDFDSVYPGVLAQKINSGDIEVLPFVDGSHIKFPMMTGDGKFYYFAKPNKDGILLVKADVKKLERTMVEHGIEKSEIQEAAQKRFDSMYSKGVPKEPLAEHLESRMGKFHYEDFKASDHHVEVTPDHPTSCLVPNPKSHWINRKKGKIGGIKVTKLYRVSKGEPREIYGDPRLCVPKPEDAPQGLIIRDDIRKGVHVISVDWCFIEEDTESGVGLDNLREGKIRFTDGSYLGLPIKDYEVSFNDKYLTIKKKKIIKPQYLGHDSVNIVEQDGYKTSKRTIKIYDEDRDHMCKGEGCEESVLTEFWNQLERYHWKGEAHEEHYAGINVARKNIHPPREYISNEDKEDCERIRDHICFGEFCKTRLWLEKKAKEAKIARIKTKARAILLLWAENWKKYTKETGAPCFFEYPSHSPCCGPDHFTCQIPGTIICLFHQTRVPVDHTCKTTESPIVYRDPDHVGVNIYIGPHHPTRFGYTIGNKYVAINVTDLEEPRAHARAVLESVGCDPIESDTIDHSKNCKQIGCRICTEDAHNAYDRFRAQEECRRQTTYSNPETKKQLEADMPEVLFSSKMIEHDDNKKVEYKHWSDFEIEEYLKKDREIYEVKVDREVMDKLTKSVDREIEKWKLSKDQEEMFKEITKEHKESCLDSLDIPEGFFMCPVHKKLVPMNHVCDLDLLEQQGLESTEEEEEGGDEEIPDLVDYRPSDENSDDTYSVEEESSSLFQARQKTKTPKSLKEAWIKWVKKCGPTKPTEERRLLKLRYEASMKLLDEGSSAFCVYNFFDKKLKELYSRVKEIRHRKGHILFDMKETKDEKKRSILQWEYNELDIELERLIGSYHHPNAYGVAAGYNSAYSWYKGTSAPTITTPRINKVQKEN